MKILLYIPSLDSGGPDRVFFELANGLAERGNDVTLLVNQEGGKLWKQLTAVVKKEVLPPHEQRYPAKQLAQFVDDSAPDVLVCTLNGVLTATIAKWRYNLRVPLIFRPANHLTRNAKELWRQSPLKHSLSWLLNIASLHAADHLVCQSPDLYDDFRSYGVPSKKMSVIGNPIRLPEDDTLAALKKERPDNVFRLIAIGRITRQKGFERLVEAMFLLGEEADLPIHLEIIGDGPDRAALTEVVSLLRMERRVVLAGPSSNVYEKIVNADYLVSSSRYEGFPNVILEALACGTPVIATDCPGGTREMVVDGVTGFLCSDGPSEAIAEAIRKAYFAPKFSPEAIRKFINDKFATDKITAAYAAVLEAVVARKKIR